MPGRDVARVLFLEHNVDGTVGGSHLCLLDICRQLDKSRYQPIVWLFQENHLVQKFRETGAEVVIERPPRAIKFVDRRSRGAVSSVLQALQSGANVLRTLVVNRRWWLRRLRQYDVSLVHLNNTASEDIDLQLAARAASVPCIAHQRGFSPPADRISRWVMRGLAAIFAISTAVRDDLLARGVRPPAVHLVFDGIDPQRVSGVAALSAEEQAAFRLSHDGPVIGIVGNVKRWKGQEVVVRAYARLCQTYPSLKCLIVGAVADQAYEAQLRELARELGVEGGLVMVGYHPRPAALMRHMDVVLHASVRPEPFGIVLLEAMALGRPVVAARAGGPMDIIVDGVTGMLAEPGNADEYAIKVGGLLADVAKARALGEAGRVRMHELFTVEANVNAIQTVYARALG